MTFLKKLRPRSPLYLMAALSALTLPLLALPFAALAQQGADKTDKAEKPITYTPKAEAAKAWGFDRSDLQPDTRTLFGVLPNGMRYAIRHNETPQETVAMRFIISVGSLAESDKQRGLAHFLEHMAFNGSTNVPEGEMVKILERSGLAFGADTNAFTNFETTGYTLDLPNNKPELIDTAFFLLRETASEITLAQGAVDRERGVILSEMRTRDDFSLQNFIEQTKFLLPDTNIADRLPIGTKAVLDTASAKDLRDFYEAHYTPDRATIVIVGDIDVAEIEAKIKATFGDWTGSNTGETDVEVDNGSVDFERGGEDSIFINPAIGESASFVAFRPYKDVPDTQLNRRKGFLRNVGYRIIGRRIGRLLRTGDAPFLGANIGSDDVFELARQTSLTISTRDGELDKGIAAAQNVIRTALEYGFTQAELDEQIANYRTGFNNAVKSAETRSNNRLAGLIVSAALNDTLVTSPQERLERFQVIASNITPDAVLAAVKEDLADLSDPLIHITAKEQPANGIASIRQSFAAAMQAPLTAPETKETKAFAYEDFGPAGEVVKDERIADLDIRTLTFANNVRLNIKKTDFEDDRVRISLRVDGGNILNTRDEPNLTTLMEIFASGGLAEHSVDELLSILAGRSVSLSFDAGTEYFGGYFTTTQQDSLLQFQLLAAYLTDPGYRQEALNRYRQSFDNYFARLKATPGSALGSEIGAILSDNDPRFSISTKEELEALEFDALQAAISPSFAHGSIEIGVVGSVDEAEIIAQIARTFGALPARNAERQDISKLVDREFTAQRGRHFVYHEGEPEQAILRFYWPTTDNDDFRETVALRLLSQIIQLRLTEVIREELGASYSPSASSFVSSTYPDYGYFTIGSNVDYSDREKVADAISRIVKGFPEKPITQDELLRARKPLLERVKLRETNNGGWLSIVDEAQTDQRALKRYRELEGVLENSQSEEIMALAVKYLGQEPLIVEAIHSSYQEAMADENS